VNGSSVGRIISVLFKDTLIIVITAIFIASAGYYIVMNQWLTGYVLRIKLHPGYFLISAVFVITIAIFAVIWQAWRAATRNPVEALRYE
jgi:putative ABC transport system permease protein